MLIHKFHNVHRPKLKFVKILHQIDELTSDVTVHHYYSADIMHFIGVDFNI